MINMSCKFERFSYYIFQIKLEDLDTGDTFSYEVKDWLVVDEANDGWKEIPAAWPAINVPKGNNCLKLHFFLQEFLN